MSAEKLAAIWPSLGVAIFMALNWWNATRHGMLYLGIDATRRSDGPISFKVLRWMCLLASVLSALLAMVFVLVWP